MKKVEYQEQLLKQMQEAEKETMPLSLFPFRVGQKHFCMPPGTVESIAEMPSQLTPIPGAPHWVLGVAFVRGASRVVLDLEEYLKKSDIGGAQNEVLQEEIAEKKYSSRSKKVINLRGRMESLVVQMSSDLDAPLFDVEQVLEQQEVQMRKTDK